MTTPGFRKVLALAALAIVAACSKTTVPSIIGHWRAERISIFSAQLPIGPEVVISEQEISSPDAGMSLSVSGFEHGTDEVTVDLAHGIGLTFYFDGPDRIYLKVPVVGKVYYRRIMNIPARVDAATSPAPGDAQPQVASTRASQPVKETQGSGTRSAIEYQMAETAAKEGRPDAAIEHLSNAFQAGFRAFDHLDSSPDFSLLRKDIRYQALVARYR